jgi:hypothetical protein
VASINHYLLHGEYSHEEFWGTDESAIAVHIYGDRAHQEIESIERLFLDHFEFTERHQRPQAEITAENVLGHFDDRIPGLTVRRDSEAAALAPERKSPDLPHYHPSSRTIRIPLGMQLGVNLSR